MDRLIRTKLGTETNKMNPEEIEKSFKDEEESEGRGEREREKEAERGLFLSPLSLRLFINKSQLTQSAIYISHYVLYFSRYDFDYTLYILFFLLIKGENHKFGMKNTHFFYYFCIFTIITVFIVLPTPNIAPPSNRHKNMFFFLIKRTTTTRQESCWELR